MTTHESRPIPIDEPSEFALHELFFSETDPKGLILSGNSVFARVSGYHIGEMLGRPHNLVRHPDMPRCVFQLLWDYLKAQQPIVAYVKNLARDGRYYWVLAHVVPTPRGYLSIRLKPSSPLFEQVPALYRDLRDLETAALEEGRTRDQAMQRGREALEATVRELGFADYTAFMHHAFITELGQRRDILSEMALRGALQAERIDAAPPRLRAVYETCRDVTQSLDVLLREMRALNDLNRGLDGRSAVIAGVSKSMHLLSMNARFEANRWADRGRALGVLASYIGDTSSRLGGDGEHLRGEIARLLPQVTGLMFATYASRLQVEMLRVFAAELASHSGSADSSDAHATQSPAARVHALERALNENATATITQLGPVKEHLGAIRQRGESLARIARSLGFAHVTGRVEAECLGDGQSFGAILDSMRQGVDSTQDEVLEMALSARVLEERMRAVMPEAIRIGGLMSQLAMVVDSLRKDGVAAAA